MYKLVSCSRRKLLAVVSFLLVTSACFPSFARIDLDLDFDQALSSWELVIYETSQDLARQNLGKRDFENMRSSLENIRSQAQRYVTRLNPIENQILREVKGLGPEPSADRASEIEQIITIRQNLKGELSRISGQIKQAELIAPRVEELLSRLSKIERQQFLEEVLSRGPVPISRSLWRESFKVTGTAWGKFSNQVEDEFETIGLHIELEQIIPVWGVVIVGLFAILFCLGVLKRRYGVEEDVINPDYHKRVVAAFLRAIRRSLISFSILALATVTFLWGGFLEVAVEEALWAIIRGASFLIIAETITKATLFPERPEWRVLPMSDTAAVQIRGIVIVIALFFSIDLFFGVIGTVAQASVSQHLIGHFFTATSMAVLVILLHRKKLWKFSGDMPVELVRVSALWSRFRKSIVIFMVVMIAAGIIGFIPLAHFAIFNMVATLGLFLMLLSAHVLIHEVARYELSGDAEIGRSLRNTLKLDDDGAGRLAFWIVFSVGCLLVIFGVIGTFLIWGMSGQRLLSIIQAAITGFKIGEVRISLIDIAVAVLLFIGMLALTKVFANILDERLLPKTKLDSGVRTAIKASVGYAGLALAVLVGVSAAGLDLSNIAIIAGALSVGIGFGLQSIVNNFVSGLILIFERPIKQGDWVVVGAEEGYVKKINVRATEIETFDRASVIIPNSDLISGTMKNWTHKNKTGRVTVMIGVSYDSNEEQVRDLLVGIAQKHPSVISRPPPYVLLMGFGASSLDFELRVFLRDVEECVRVASDLRFSILKQLRENGIEIPFPQQDIRIKELPSVSDIENSVTDT
ncbi:DUF3772 domain-containing protein [Kiloniella antarctica]|uniref:DUF3772 domain-containing protein n=1 Tax=Kiloniella antarctica TaxID=1550907 RepID=A0ABW5BJK3_9PROT